VAKKKKKPAAARLKILLVDDEPDTLRLYELWLEQRGYEVRTAYNAETALSIAPRFQPDIVIADLWMPGLDGMELCRRLKADPATRGVFLVLSSGRPPLQIEDECRAVRVDRFLDKPTPRSTFNALMDSIDRGFAARAARA
jgi:sigma-B regulation protein RsbU (phosphoserine phosphatase)